MWSDSVLAAERAHLLRVLIWGAASVLAGTGVLALRAASRAPSPLLLHFGIQTAAWGAVCVAIAGFGWRGLADRDLSGVTRLLNILWLNVGLDAGYVGVGATLAIAGWTMGRRLGAVGAGVAIVVQGLALLALDARFVALLRRAVE
ncbi:MAG: hypothetical protein WKG32_15335 [Gemmatimonadaceae bacterium]